MLQPVHKFIVGIAFHWRSANQSPDEVLAIKSALASTFVNANFSNRALNFNTRDNSGRYPEFSGGEVQYAGIVAFFPSTICLFADKAKLTSNDMRTL